MLENSKKYNGPIVTKITPFSNFYKAEEYHKKYFENNRQTPYFQIVINPKIIKLLEEFKEEVEASKHINNL